MMKKTKKRLFIVLCAVLCLCALAACGEKPHTHDFTKVGSDATGHWMYCEQDNVKDPASFEAHKDEDKNGKCDVCGYDVGTPAPEIKWQS